MFNDIPLIRLLALICTAWLLTSCGGLGKKSTEERADIVEKDITRPPEFIRRDAVEQENDPDEIISYDEWKKEQDRKQD